MQRPEDNRPAERLRMRTFAVASILAIALAAAACGDDDGGEASGSSGSPGEREEVSIGLELVGGGDFINETTTGAEQAAEDLGPIDLEIQMPPPGLNPTIAQKQVADMLAQRPDALGIAPLPASQWRRTLTTVNEQVEHVLAPLIKPADTPDQVDDALIDTYVGINDVALGREALKATIEAAGLGPDTTGTALLGQCVPGNSGTLYERRLGFEQALEQELPNVRAQVFDSKPTPQENTNAWESILNANRDPVLAIGTCDIDGASLFQLKRRSGADFPVGALEAPPDTIRGLKDGSIDAAVAVNWWLSGYTSVRLLAEAARGGDIPEGWIDTGFTLLNRDNADEIEERDASPAAAARWYAPKVEELFSNLQAKPLEDAWK